MESCKSAYQKQCFWGLYLTLLLITGSKGISVSLSVEGGISLIGAHCPGNVTLFCEGVNQAVLRWRYNGNKNIISYFADLASTTQPFESAFFSPRLTAVKRNPSDPILANFTSTLTVNFSQLQTNNVVEISCGDSSQSITKPVNVSIIQPAIPTSLTITMVTAIYQIGKLSNVKLTWMKLDNFCVSNGFPLEYVVNVSSYSSITVDNINCGEVCMTDFNEFTERAGDITLSIKAQNIFGSSPLVYYPATIALQVQQFFSSEVFLNDNRLVGRCIVAESLAENSVCVVQYTTNLMYQNLSNETVVPLNKLSSIVENIASGTTYYFVFSLIVDTSLRISNRVNYSPSPDSKWWIALIVVVFVGIGCVVLIITLVIILCKKKNNHYSIKQVSMSPCEDQPLELSFTEKESSNYSVDGSKKYPIVSADDSKQYPKPVKLGTSISADESKECPKPVEQGTFVSADDSKECPKPVEQGISISVSADESKECPKSVEHGTSVSVDDSKECPKPVEQSISASVIDSKECALPDRHIEYQVYVSYQNKTYHVSKRYREFKKLYDLVKPNFRWGAENLYIPGKKIFTSKFDPELIKQRKAELNDFVIELVKIQGIIEFPVVKEFLEIDKPESL